MLRCWQYDPTKRPSFVKIVEELRPGLRPDFLKVSYFGTIEYNEVEEIDDQDLLSNGEHSNELQRLHSSDSPSGPGSSQLSNVDVHHSAEQPSVEQDSDNDTASTHLLRKDDGMNSALDAALVQRGRAKNGIPMGASPPSSSGDLKFKNGQNFYHLTGEENNTNHSL